VVSKAAPPSSPPTPPASSPPAAPPGEQDTLARLREAKRRTRG
jgi:hypothetical protein